MREQIISDYALFEPAGHDTWNPAFSDMQLGYRMGLIYALGRAFKISKADIRTLQVVDIGCGNGRSTRAYQEFGLTPAQLCGLDFRPSAIAAARQMHPAIRYDVQRDVRLPFDDGSVDWVSLCMVISSIRDARDRAAVSLEVRRVLKPGGILFYFDHFFALDTCGGDTLAPDGLFASLSPRWGQELRLVDLLPDYKDQVSHSHETEPASGWRFGRGRGILSWIPRPHRLAGQVKARLPKDVQRWLSGEPKMFEIRLFAA